MTDEIRSAITSDKVETDNTNFATVKADQSCEEVLIPRDDPFRQLNWEVTLEKGSVYNPQEEIGIYGSEIDCKYGVQINGDIFGRDNVSIEHGGAAQSASDESTLGAQIFGSVISEGRVDIVEPSSTLDDWEKRPATVYGDVVGSHVTFEEPTVVYGCVSAEKTFRVNAPSVVLGDVQSEGIVEATDLFAFSINAQDDITLGANVAVANPAVRSEQGEIHIADEVGIFSPMMFDAIRESNDIEMVGPWILDVEEIWKNSLQPIDVTDNGEGQLVSRAWRTPTEDAAFYERVRDLFNEMVDATRKDQPDIEEFRYTGIGSIGDLGGEEISVEGDMVIGSQEKQIDETTKTEIDQSTTEIDQSTEVHDESTTVEDSVVNRSDVGDEQKTTDE